MEKEKRNWQDMLENPLVRMVVGRVVVATLSALVGVLVGLGLVPAGLEQCVLAV